MINALPSIKQGQLVAILLLLLFLLLFVLLKCLTQRLTHGTESMMIPIYSKTLIFKAQMEQRDWITLAVLEAKYDCGVTPHVSRSFLILA